MNFPRGCARKQATQFIVDNKKFICDLTEREQLTIHAALNSYPVFFNHPLNPFNHIANLLTNHSVLLIDSRVMELYHPHISIPPEKIFIIEATENFKTLAGVTKILEFLDKNALTKSDQLIIVGGGVVQEAGAFAAAIYKRGIAYIHFPTTLLSMCDSCIGGKTSLNHHDAKNQLGLYYNPSYVYIYTDFLKTLSDRDIKSGLGEILKLCIIGGKNCLKIYEQCISNGRVNDFNHYVTLINVALNVKKSIIEVDEFEKNERRSMNYGHTFGHAIEALSDYKIPHGLAITLGMILENNLSVQEKLLDPNTAEKLNKLCFELLDEATLSIYKKIPQNNIFNTLKKDKKVLGDMITFALIKKMGEIYFSQQPIKNFVMG